MSLITNEDQRKCIDDFTADLEKSLGVKHQKVSFNDLWSTDPPEEAERQTLLEYMKDVRLSLAFVTLPAIFLKSGFAPDMRNKGKPEFFFL